MLSFSEQKTGKVSLKPRAGEALSCCKQSLMNHLGERSSDQGTERNVDCAGPVYKASGENTNIICKYIREHLHYVLAENLAVFFL